MHIVFERHEVGVSVGYGVSNKKLRTIFYNSIKHHVQTQTRPKLDFCANKALACKLPEDIPVVKCDWL